MPAAKRTRGSSARGSSARRSGSRLRPGPNGLARSQVADIQRRRILAGMFEVACSQGAGNVTVAHVVQRSGVSRRTFYELFEDREDCFLAAFEDALERVSERVLDAYRSKDGWQAQIRAGLVELLGFLDEQPAVGRLLMCESLAAGQTVLERRARVIAILAAAIGDGHTHARGGSEPLPLAAEATVGGVLSLIHERLCMPGHGSMIELAGPLMSMIVLPYLGASAARRELKRPLPPSPLRKPREGVPPLVDLFKGAGMRLTYRTVRVLNAVAEHPRASNRLIGQSAGIADQGQISKLLARLQRSGLVTNNGLGVGRGAANAWALTPAGESVVHNIATNGEDL